MPREPRDDRVHLWEMLQYLKERIEVARIWAVISEHAPALKRQIQTLVEDLPPIEEK